MEEDGENLAEAQTNVAGRRGRSQSAHLEGGSEGLTGAGRHGGPEGSRITCQVSECRAVTERLVSE